MDKLIPGILIAALSAITFLAYKHPRAYSRLYLVVVVGGSLILMGLALWDAALVSAHKGLLRYIPAENLAAAKAARDQMFVQSDWIVFGSAAVFCYLVFLHWVLPWLLGDERPPEK